MSDVDGNARTHHEVTSDSASAIEGWAILELMGHRKLAGYLQEVQVGGASFIRIDVPGEGEDPIATQLYSPSAVYCITPTTEELAHQIARRYTPTPVSRYELPVVTRTEKPDEDYDGFNDDNDRF